MLPPGHVAASLLLARRFRLDGTVILAAGLLPDLVDKAVFYVLRLSHWNRIPAHSLTGWVAASLLFACAIGLRLLVRPEPHPTPRAWRWGAAWVLGYAMHLVCDASVGDGMVPWLWPFRQYAGVVSSSRPWFLQGGSVPWSDLAIEAVLIVAVVLTELARRRRPLPELAADDLLAGARARTPMGGRR